MKDQGFQPQAIGAAQMAAPDAVPHYFSHPNYANSALPTVANNQVAVGNPLQDRAYATDNAAEVFVVNPAATLPIGTLLSFEVQNQATAGGSFAPSAGLTFHAYVLRPTGTASQYTVVFDSGPLTMPTLADAATSATATFALPAPGVAVQAGDVIAHYGQGIPLDVDVGTDVACYPVAAAPVAGSTITVGDGTYPIYPQARTYSIRAQVVDESGTNVTIAGGIRKFVDGLPGLGASGANNLGQYIPVAVADTTTFADADYYEIAVVEYTERMHSDLSATKLRGYVQLSTSVVPGGHVDLGNGYTAVDNPHYLGPVIQATKDRPVRILFRNLLPTGTDGNLFIPVDTTVMGSGWGPNHMSMTEMDPQRPEPGMLPKPPDAFTESRAVVHLHGGINPWISDGTPHQWVTPDGETFSDGTPLPEGYDKGVSAQNVPDMWFDPTTHALVPAGTPGATNDPGPGAVTLYYTNQQSARLMFYHDHAWGITRLNVYVGMVAPYLIADDTEQALIAAGTIPGPDATIPLVVQDKTFVPSEAQLATQDELWDLGRWGGEGSLWVPHVYSPAQNPGDASGVNAFGRWAYGPWFWPPTTAIQYGPIANFYYDATCDVDAGWCEPPLMPGVPFLSMGMEAFNDTPLVNGTAYPYVEVDPKAYRLRILNGANDRFFNLSLYKADASGTEVALDPALVADALNDPAGVFPTPVPGSEGPSWIQIGTEGGFLPSPVVVPPQHITWVTDPTVFNAGNVDKHGLLLGPAERADVIVDFSAFAGQTLILYNDAPAAFPARDPRYDYYTGNADLRDTGGAPSTLPGYGPNTRTVMQVRVKAATPAPFDQAKVDALNAAFAHKADGTGVFESSQHPIIVGQQAYNITYGTAFKSNEGLVQIYDTKLTFGNTAGATFADFPLKPKMIQDEMGEAFEHEYGRMSGNLGVETPNASAGNQNMILYGYIHPPTEVIDGSQLPRGMTTVTPIASLTDGTQIWKITHNGVDTHPVHFHLYDLQLLNRVGWDGIIRKPDANELGWKETIRVSPLEDTIVALRPVIPALPFDLPNSIRPIDPSMALGTQLVVPGVVLQDPLGNPINDLPNHLVNFGWEYVWHCHILSHEEMDMMRPQVVGVPPKAPVIQSVTLVGNGKSRRADLEIADRSTNETAFVIERATSGDGPWTVRQTVASNGTGPSVGTLPTVISDPIGNTSTVYVYRVKAINVVGDTATANFPTVTLESAYSDINSWITVPPEVPAAPTNVAATAATSGKGATVTLTWTDASAAPSPASGFEIQYATNATFTSGQTIATVAAGVTTYTTPRIARSTEYFLRVKAFNIRGASAWAPLPSGNLSITTPA